MKIYFKKFSLSPKFSLNRLSGTQEREGVFLFGESKSGIRVAEYFPHPEFGDPIVDDFLYQFERSNSAIVSKIKYFLSFDINELNPSPFRNHQLWRPGDKLWSKTIKYKLQHKNDYIFLSVINEIHKIRLDANGLFSRKEIEDYIRSIPENVVNIIDYIEDPTFDKNWSNLGISVAQDFILGDFFDTIIHKPCRQFFPQSKKQIIFSANMGHIIGQYHDYRELINLGNLQFTHGLVAPSLYETVPELYKMDNETFMFQFDYKNFEILLNQIVKSDWNFLCQS
jgi:hypothetical protein